MECTCCQTDELSTTGSTMKKNYREWILSPILVAVAKPGFIHHEMAVQACISIESTNNVTAYIIKRDNLYTIALKAPSDFECRCAENIINHLLSVDRSI